MKDTVLTEKEAEGLIKGKLSRFYGVSVDEATEEQVYKAVVLSVRDILLEMRRSFHEKTKKNKGKRVYYLCMEYLIGRSLKNNLFNLSATDAFKQALKNMGFDIEKLYEDEPDAGLGNGGLGRLAACFMDALATQNYPAMGFTLRYEYGLFKQKIVDGWQTELPDIWLPGGEFWLAPRTDKRFTVKFDGHLKERWTEDGLKVDHFDFKEVEAVAYDMMMSGYDSEAVSVLRLWRASNINKFDMKSFSQGDYMRSMEADNEAELITKVLYPTDDHSEGKSLRIKQQYFLVSASLQNILADHKSRYGSLDSLPELAAIHINDTHPALAVAELMRLLIDENGYGWDAAWDIVTRTVAYTNHTVLSEALEKWSEDLISRRLPRIYQIIKEINERFCREMWEKFPGDWDKIERMSIFSHGQIRMANLSVIGSHSINGVSKLHSGIIKESIFKDFCDVWPDKFKNVTNGIAHRRWLCQSNPELTSLISDLIGTGFYKDASKLTDLKKFENDKSVLDKINEIKLKKKKDFAAYLRKKTGVIIDPSSVYDVQAKRLHEYKRQLMNAMNIISEYLALKENPDLNVLPKTYIFGAKAAPGYYLAKKIIKLICFISEDIKKHPKIREKLSVVYLEDYRVTLAERLIPATEISQQISTAGKEASGTGNMKFMINGALTVGTLDGANVEMSEAVGLDNIYIFGMTAAECEDLWKSVYKSTFYYNQNEKVRKVLEAMINGFNGESFSDLSNYLLTGTPIADPYMCIADFESYTKVMDRAMADYADREKWAKMSLNNIASAGIFAADRSIREYAENIWGLKSL